MDDFRLARLWNEIRQDLEADDMPYEMVETRSPRSFFAVDESSSYVVRVQERGGSCVLTRTFAPGRSVSVAAYEQGKYG